MKLNFFFYYIIKQLIITMDNKNNISPPQLPSLEETLKKFKLWENTNPNILGEEEKNTILENIVDGNFIRNGFSFSNLNLIDEKISSLFKSGFFKMFFDGNYFNEIIFDYQMNHIELDDYVANIFKYVIVKTVSFNDCKKFSDQYVSVICEIIKNSKYIEHLRIYNSNLNDKHIGFLCESLNGNKKMKTLSFKNCGDLTDECVEYFIKICKTTSIEYIFLNGVHRINPKNKLSIKKLSLDNFLKNGNKDLDFECYSEDDEFIFLLSESLKENKVSDIKKIDFSKNSITSEGFSALIGSLLELKNENIEEIYMDANKLNDDCIENLGKLILQNANITAIGLQNNKITDKGVEILSQYIIGNTSIQHLYLCGNESITEQSFKTIIDILTNSYIKYIEFDDHKMEEEMVSLIEKCRDIPCEEREVPLLTITDVKSASKRMREE